MAGRIPGQFRNPPSWMKRALNPKTPTTKKNETIKTRSVEHNGKEILFPTIRMGRDGKFRKSGYKEAVRRRDYMTFDNPDAATKFSKRLSRMISHARKGSN
jgi:hypothetical protein|tara:strand:- start:587 stop:889 length:303 start_codon:yes stop_codon:yes gene_type:complete